MKLDASLVGPEPAHGWCYYFEKSDLALQQKDYMTIKKNYQSVIKKSLSPKYGFEWAPFIEGLAQAGDWQDSVKLAQQVITENPPKVDNQSKEDYQSFICRLFTQLNKESTNPGQAAVALKTLNCGK